MTEILNTLICIIVKCLPERVKEIKDYNLPYHPCLIKEEEEEEEQQQDDTSTVISDLYFFYVKNILNDKTITCAMIHQIHESKVNVSPSSTKRYEILQNLHRFIKYYLVIYCSGLFLCEENHGDNTEQWHQLLKNILINYIPLQIDQHEHLFSNELQLFLSTIIIRQNWNYLLDLLKSEFLRNIDHQWTTTMFQLLETQLNFRKKNIQLYDQIQFTLSSATNEHILFAKLQNAYKYLSTIFDICIRNRFEINYWLPLLNWINEQENK
ncbi:unnamed protein product [Didymodactylos carnosus]|uniref:Uncharacterized protein n=1 Tax=Didymodactylos carnosus TaxID=1234261 RepID=A0A814TYY9_9BILA|nr:unnamed protein product [Didymodactylos carnosus]CAF3928354.1 unnamed protein product [Didymodactylos carnosus]